MFHYNYKFIYVCNVTCMQLHVFHFAKPMIVFLLYHIYRHICQTVLCIHAILKQSSVTMKFCKHFQKHGHRLKRKNKSEHHLQSVVRFYQLLELHASFFKSSVADLSQSFIELSQVANDWSICDSSVKSHIGTFQLTILIQIAIYIVERSRCQINLNHRFLCK